jgi:hypothetical protein
MKTRCMAQVCFLVTVAVQGAAGQKAYPIEASQAVLALAAKGVEASVQQVSMVANVVASQPHPTLGVLAVGHLGLSDASANGSGARFWVKLGCQEAGVCLPFYAMVALPTGDTAALIEGLRNAGKMKGVGIKHDKGFTIPAGARATLVLEGSHSRVEIPVVALEPGMAGSEIRIATPDRRNSYRAIVVGPGVLKGYL